MKIILVNKYYYERGGDCTYTLGLEKLLTSDGIDVSVFSMHNKNNLYHPNAKYWLSSIDYTKMNYRKMHEGLIRPLYSSEVRKKFIKILNDVNPNIIHLNNIHTQISPLIAKIAYEFGIKVVWTLHDYKLVCPSYTLFRQNKPCELCINYPISVLKNKCIKGSIIGSVIGYLESLKWNLNVLQKYTNKFICPSYFMKKMMIKAGVEEEKLVVLHNFIDNERIIDLPITKEKYICYFGRLSEEKGIRTLLQAMVMLPNQHLKIIGTGPLLQKLKEEYINCSNIEFLGYKTWNDLKHIVMKAQFTILAAEWYENNPISILESFALGTPVIASNIGGLPELIDENETGILFKPGDSDDLSKKNCLLF